MVTKRYIFIILWDLKLMDWSSLRYGLHEWTFKFNSRSQITPDDANIFFYSPQLLSLLGRESFWRDVEKGKIWLRRYIQAVSALLSLSADTIFLAWKILYGTNYFYYYFVLPFLSYPIILLSFVCSGSFIIIHGNCKLLNDTEVDQVASQKTMRYGYWLIRFWKNVYYAIRRTKKA